MLVPEPIVKSGLFFSPENPDEKFPGTLTISEGGRVELEITATKVAFTSVNDVNIGTLIGEVDGGYVTLEGCSYRNMALAFMGMPGKSRIYADTAFDGDELPNPALFSSFRFNIDGLSEWLGASAFQINHGERFEDTTISIKNPGQVHCVLPDKTELKINVEITVPGNIKFPTIELFHQAYILVKPCEPKPFDYYKPLSHKVTRLFSFLIGKPVAIHSLNATIFENQKSDFPNTVNIYFRSLNSTEKSNLSNWDMLLTYRHISEHFESLLCSWLADFDNLQPALHHHHAVQGGIHQYADARFLAIAQALEALHRRTHTGLKSKKSEYKAKVASILKECPEEHKSWVKEKLSFGNEISFGERLHELIDRFGGVFGDREKIDKIVSATVKTRNYHAHYDPNGESRTSKGAALVSLIFRLRVLFILSLLVRLGLSEDEATKICEFDYIKKMLSNAEYLDSSESLSAKK